MFSGPSKDVVLQMARGVASFAMQIHMLGQLPPSDRATIIAGMKNEGSPTTMEELVSAAASVVSQQKMGWLRKNQYLGAIQGHLVAMGMSNRDATFIKGLIELRMP